MLLERHLVSEMKYDDLFPQWAAALANEIYGNAYNTKSAHLDGNLLYNDSLYLGHLSDSGTSIVFDRGDTNETFHIPGHFLIEDELKYDTSMDPISPDFNSNSWATEDHKDPRAIMEMFLDITKETMIGDIIVVPEHRCDIHDSQAQLASQFMHAYNIDSMQCIVYSGMQITFRKVSE